MCGQHSRAPPSGAPGLEGRPGVLRQLFGAVLPAVSHGCHCCGRFLEGPAPATRAFLTGQAGRVTLWARPSLKLCTHGVPGGISEAAFPSTGDTVSSHAAGTRSLRARSGIGTAPSTRCRPSHVSLPTTCASRLLAYIQPRLRQVSHAARVTVSVTGPGVHAAQGPLSWSSYVMFPPTTCVVLVATGTEVRCKERLPNSEQVLLP